MCAMKALSIFCVVAALAAGCASWRLQTLRSARFVDDDGNYIHVDYARDTEEHRSTFTLENGVRVPYSSRNAMRVELPDGTTFIAYQNMTPAGTLYKSDDDEWEFFESGAGCIVAQLAKDKSGYIPRFRGTLCATVRNPMTDGELRLKKERNEKWKMNPDARLDVPTKLKANPNGPVGLQNP